jgi:hypothetical protein
VIFQVQVTKPLLETSRNGYLAAISASSYSFVSLLKHFVPIMNPGTFLTSFLPLLFFNFYLYVLLFPSPSHLFFFIPIFPKCCWNLTLGVDFTGGASISLTYIASERIIPGYVFLFILNIGVWFIKEQISSL